MSSRDIESHAPHRKGQTLAPISKATISDTVFDARLQSTNTPKSEHLASQEAPRSNGDSITSTLNTEPAFTRPLHADDIAELRKLMESDPAGCREAAPYMDLSSTLRNLLLPKGWERWSQPLAILHPEGDQPPKVVGLFQSAQYFLSQGRSASAWIHPDYLPKEQSEVADHATFAARAINEASTKTLEKNPKISVLRTNMLAKHVKRGELFTQSGWVPSQKYTDSGIGFAIEQFIDMNAIRLKHMTGLFSSEKIASYEIRRHTQ